MMAEMEGSGAVLGWEVQETGGGLGCGRIRKGDKVRALLRVVSVTGVFEVAFSWRKVSKNRDVKSGVGMFQKERLPREKALAQG